LEKEEGKNIESPIRQRRIEIQKFKGNKRTSPKKENGRRKIKD
jgi:hypothetical protein